ncbi:MULTISPECIES: DUF2752 domain-containing protein [Streptomycetaceae]|uniref:DUF2752 domain-containing protein n=1 Tax=Streptomycetaceae TaxID=2062 RepID=UPI000213EA8F|nr:DUF2752 domain-containing protein [Streptantibioticus cattleyicolor]MYS59693.1 DUF2752 domain-containing protein [Streptomyces sp. SID5468]CCB75450.1 conserved protein of unknown function [Streptantibioticus cattleyicolor NRRL 8057 = DSM 46488]
MPTPSWPLTVGWEDRDAHPRAVPLALAGGAGAAAMAVFGLPPVDLHGPLHFLGVMDPLCGMTRASRLLVLGHIGDALRYNPAAPALAAGAVAALVKAAWGRAVGRWCTVRLSRHGWAALFWVLVIAGWETNQQADAEHHSCAAERVPARRRGRSRGPGRRRVDVETLAQPGPGR